MFLKTFYKMARLKFLLGLIPSTSKIEEAEKALITEFEKLKAFSKSDQLARYVELNENINSAVFAQKRREIESLKYKNSDEFNKEKEYKKLQKAKDITRYFKTLSGSRLKKHFGLDGSDKIKEYESLGKFIKSEEFKEKKKMKSSKFRQTEEYQKFQKYKRLKSDSDIVDFYKFKASKELDNYKNIRDSQRLNRYKELKEYVASEEFKKQKSYLLDKKRFEKSEMFKNLQEYGKLKKDKEIIWYFKTKDLNKFDVLKSRELTFCDEFEGNKLDDSKWIPNYYWGEKLLNDRYSVENDLQAYTEKENFEIRNSVLKIITRPQKTNGKIWTIDKGFVIKEFDYTSGIICSGASFRQKYGIFQAKIKLGNANAKSAFWMLADKIIPHIDVCKTSGGKVWFDFFPLKGNVAKTSLGSRYAGKFYIFTLEWTADKLVWKINNTEVFTQTSDIPQDPMYMLLSGGLDKPISGTTSMEIDWVRVYKFV